MASVILFGDQTVDCRTFLQNICSHKGNVLLTSFLDLAGVALQDEIIRMPHAQQLPNISGFSNVADLVARYQSSSEISPALDSSLVVLTQLSHFIRSSSEQANDFYNYRPSNVRLIGMCTGLFAASAITSATSITSLIPLAIEVLRLAFRTGSLVADLAEKLEPGSRESWATAVHVKNLEKLEATLGTFHNENEGFPQTSRAWISLSSTNSATISGPPAVVKRLFKSSEYLSALEKIKVAIHGPYHARHLFSKADIRKILRPETPVIFGSSSIRFSVYSTATGKPFLALNPFQLLEECLEEILMEPLRWHNVFNTCTSGDICPSGSLCDVYTFGPTHFTASLVAALKTGNIEVKTKNQSWPSTESSTENLVAAKGCPIAIVGFSGRFPNAANHELLWDLLEKGLDVHREVPKSRFNVDTHVDEAGKIRNTSHTPYGCFIDEPGLFDARFFNMSPREALQTDPMQRLTLVTAYEAMQMAGIVPGQTPSSKPDRIGTFYGQTSDDWREINAAQDIDTYFISGGVRAFGPGRVNYHFKFSGPSFSIDTACSSSLAAIQLACTSLQARQCDTAFTGGSNILTNPDIFSGLSRGHFLSKTGSCKTFDNDADGYCRGDGVATVILKRLDDALLDRDPVFGVIQGTATNHSAEAISITHPHAGAQKVLFSSVLRDAGVDAYDVNYVEMHGTGTQAGDGVEMDSVSSVFAPRTRKPRRKNQPLYLGAIKSNIGHGEAVSGVCGLIKILLMFQKNTIPPHAGIKGVINKSFPVDLKERNINIAMKRTEFPRPVGESRIAMLNNFSAAGGNTALLLEDGPIRQLSPEKDPRSTQVVCVTAKSLASFRTNLARLKLYVNGQTDINLSSLAYTSTSRRIHYNYRSAFAINEISQLKAAIERVELQLPSPTSPTAAPVVFLFTGQGAQYAAMVAALYTSSKQFRADLESFSNISESLGFSSFLGMVSGSFESNESELLSPMTVQIGMVCLQVALVRLWASWGIKPDIVMGHSLGEYAALNTAGVLSIADTIYLVGNRAKLLTSNCVPGTHGMLAVKAAFELVGSLRGEHDLEVACINGPSEMVLSGTMAEIDKMTDILNSRNLPFRKLDVSFAFHSPQVEPILLAFEKTARSVTFHRPKIPVVSTLLGEAVIDEGVFTPTYVARHCREPVDFSGALSSAIREKLVDSKTTWLEIGSHPICSGMVKSTMPSAFTTPSLRRGEDAWKTMSTSISALYSAGLSPDWVAYHRDFEEFAETLDLPKYGFDEKVYWLDYTNDWCLSKGQTTDLIPKEVVLEEPKIKSTTIQRILQEEVVNGTATVIAETDLQDPKLHTAVSGHLVNGAALCPSSIYADMALTIASHAVKLVEPKGKDFYMNVRNMECPAPLILKNLKTAETQLVQVDAKLDLKLRQANVSIYSLSSNGKTKTIHGKCVVDFEDVGKWHTKWDRNAFLIQTRIDMLQKSIDAGTAHQILRGMAYKLFSALVQYSDKFRGMKEITLGNGSLEAMARVEFQATAADGDFHTSPYYIDSVAHLAGFIMNANDAVDSASQVYISHGWESMRFAKPLESDKKYTSYVKMQPLGGAGSKMFAGDVYVFDEAMQIIGVVGGLKFQCIPRTLLDTFLPPVKKGSATSHSTLAKASSVGNQKRGENQNVPPPVFLSHKETTMITLEQPDHSKATMKQVVVNTYDVGGASDLLVKAIDIIATEVGVDTSELAENIHFADLGVDSLMSLTISGRFREELALEVHSTLFTDFPSIRDLKLFLAQQDSSSPDSVDAPDEGDIALSTPNSSLSDYSSDITTPSNEKDDAIALIRETIAEEMGMNIEEIAETTDLTQIGMDSLMGLTILGILRERTGFNFDSNFLNDNKSISEVRSAMEFEMKSSAVPAIEQLFSGPDGVSISLMSQQSTQIVSSALSKAMTTPKLPPATAVLLQGSVRTATKKLFLLPDGSGSATSYASIPPIAAEDLCVYGLNCPFMKDPTSYTCGVEGVSTLYLNEILRRQPEGPYLLGGWSAGGVVAFEVTRQLIALQKQNPSKDYRVSNLILIDAPCPIRLERLPSRLHIFFDQIGLLGTGNPKGTPEWLLPHFQYSIQNLSAYQPVEADNFDGMPKTLLIWAEDGVCKNPGDPRPAKTDDEPKSMSWLLDNRTDFSPNNWEKLVGAHNCTCVRVTGNHFTMMRDPVDRELSRLMKEELNL